MIGDGTVPRRFRIAINALAVLTIVALLLAGWALHSRFTATNQFRQTQQQVWHAVICTVVAAEQHNKNLTPQEKAHETEFWNKLLVQKVGALPCTRKESHASPTRSGNVH